MEDVNRLKYACRKEEDKQKAYRRVESPPTQQYPCKKGTDKVQIHGEETYAL